MSILKSRKAQLSFERIMVYGFAILVVIVVIGILYSMGIPMSDTSQVTKLKTEEYKDFQDEIINNAKDNMKGQSQPEPQPPQPNPTTTTIIPSSSGSECNVSCNVTKLAMSIELDIILNGTELDETASIIQRVKLDDQLRASQMVYDYDKGWIIRVYNYSNETF